MNAPQQNRDAGKDALRRGAALDVGHMPTFAFGTRSPMWWGTMGLVAIESTVFALTIMTYFYLRSHASVWPMSRFPPDLLKAKTVSTIVPGGRTGAEAEPRSGQPSMLGRFTILNGARAGEKLGLGGSGIRIGRESTICEIVLENPKVSRLHAEVVSIDGKVLLIDRNSSNGTYVNDQKIDKRFLKDGDIIYFGGRNAVAVAFHA